LASSNALQSAQSNGVVDYVTTLRTRQPVDSPRLPVGQFVKN